MPRKKTSSYPRKQTRALSPSHGESFAHGWLTQILVLLLAIVTTYFHTLDVPFYMDDVLRIQENSLIYDWQGIEALWRYGPMRFVGYLSLAMNFRLGQFQPEGYHFFNILIHFLTTAAVYFFARTLIQTPRIVGRVSSDTKHWLPLLVALLFALHPLQTQAVTYIVQRLASLAAMFYIASMVAFLKARLADRTATSALWIGLCLVAALLAFFTKQNTVTLPFALLLIEAVFFPGSWKRLVRVGGVALVSLAVVWFLFAVVFQYDPFSLEAMQSLTRETTEISRTAYLATQLPVLWTYLRLYLVPIGLHLDYAIVALDGPGHAVVWVALIFHLLVVGFAIWVWRRWPWISFAILFYYLAHGVESSLIPIRDVVFEHRTYLPNLGLSLLLGWFLLVELPRWLPRRAVQVGTVVLLLVLGSITWQRNQMWRSPIAFWRDNVELAAEKSRPWASYGRSLLDVEQPLEASRAIEESIRLQIRQDSTAILNRIDINNLVIAYHMMGQYERALELTRQFIDQAMTDAVRAKFFVNQGLIFTDLQRIPEAEESYRRALELSPHNLPAKKNLAGLFVRAGRLEEAEAIYVEILRIDPNDQITSQALNQLRARRGAAPGS